MIGQTADQRQRAQRAGPQAEPKAPAVGHSYARSALKLGLRTEAELGVNPFKFGMVGSTDSHTALATAYQNNFWARCRAMNPAGTV